MVGSVATSAASASVTIAEVLELRASGLTEAETWALLCQCAQALQDLFIAKSASTAHRAPGLCPSSVRVSCRGRVRLSPARDAFLAPEYSRHQLSNTEDQVEKMWIYSLGRTLRAAVAQGRLSAPLDDVLTAMTLPDARRRAALIDVLDVISRHCKSRSSPKPFSHVTMDLYREVLGSPSSPITQCLPSNTETTPSAHLSERVDVATPVARSRSMREARRHPVQRAPSRLYRAVSSIETKPHAKYTCPNTCIGPEFVVRASSPRKRIQMLERKSGHSRQITVVLLNGQKLEVVCDSSCVTAGHVYETVLQVERLDENYFLGLAALLSGDFVFLSLDTRLSKVAPKHWRESSLLETPLTLYLRVKFFLPSLRGVRRWTTKHLMYLQLRRSLLERQIRCDAAQLASLAGLALQAEFGDHDEAEHGVGDYFLLEHYVPLPHGELATQLRDDLMRQHRERRGLDPGRAEEMFVTQAQQLSGYGAHFYSATSVGKKDGVGTQVWLAVSGQGIFLYDAERNLNKFYVWRSIQKLCYSKQYFVLHPCSDVKGIKPVKHKFLMDSNKSFFVFHLASLHHQFFMKLRIELSSLQSLSVEFGVPLRRIGKEGKKLFFVEDKPPVEVARVSPPARLVADAATPEYRLDVEESQNKENERPDKEMGDQEAHSLPFMTASESDNSSYRTTSYPRRIRVKMGTRAIQTTPRELFTSRDTVHTPDVASLPVSPLPEAYVLNSSIKSTDERFHLDFQETLSDSLIEKFDNASFADERILRTLTLRRDDKMSLGMQITEGSDGGVYVQSVTEGGAAHHAGCIHAGDQLIAVDGHTLLNLKYHEALYLLQASGGEVELVFSQIFSGESTDVGDHHYPRTPQHNGRRYSSGIDLLSDILQKPIEDSYLKNIRYETAVELDGDGNEMVSSPIPTRCRVERRRGPARVGDVTRASRGWQSPEKSPPTTTLRAVCCVMPLDDDDVGPRSNGYL